MITAQEAYEKLIKKKKYYATDEVRCREYPDFYVFFFRPAGHDGNYDVGIYYDAVEKESGRIFMYNITSNPLLRRQAKEVKIERFLDKPV